VNPRLDRPLSDAEVARERPPTPENLNDTLFVLSFSGGGTRAAALAYGVLETLAAVRVPEPSPHRLLDEIDLLTSVSGGSFTAAYYGLAGDRIFTEFEPRFLRARIGRALFLRLLSPLNWIRLASGSFDRSDLAAEVYDDYLFDGATFADINARPGPLIAIQATDLLEGNRFGFSQHNFGLICSDVMQFPLARAVAASAAFPLVFSPIVLEPFVVEVSFDKLADDGERRSFDGIPTTFDLADAEIDRLREVGGRLLRQSPTFWRLLRSLSATLDEA
jgi:NTE family protein